MCAADMASLHDIYENVDEDEEVLGNGVLKHG